MTSSDQQDSRGTAAAQRVIAVVVAYNRAELLAETLDALGGQTRPLDGVIVVDNASGDSSAEVARSHPVGVDLLSLDRNTGGAGGFTAGIARALAVHGGDLVWVMDDDTIPSSTALSELLRSRDRYPGRVVALGSRVVWVDGCDHPMNTPRRRPFVRRGDARRARQAAAMPVRTLSFVSMMIDLTEVRRLGLPVADYFIWNDDFEYSGRLLRRGVGLHVPGSVVEHRTRYFRGSDSDPGPRFYFEVRNKIWLLSRSPAFGPLERPVYLAVMLRRWVRTFLRSGNRRALVRAGSRGLWHGLSRRPRPNLEVFAFDPDVARTIGWAERGASWRLGDLRAEPFAVLLPVYLRDRLEYLSRSFDSVTRDQVLKPAQVVIVRDGPVSREVARFLDDVARTSEVPVTTVSLERNLGLARALEAGLAACRYEIVARADADDISLPGRFAIQVPMVRAGYDLVGSAVQEFASESQPGVIRVPPTGAAEISRYARFHDPLNHPTVVFRKSAVRAAGGYQSLPLLEDYLLFTRMIACGAKVGNSPQPLVMYRVGAGAYARRGGVGLLRSEFKLQQVMRREGFTTRWQFLRNVAVRCGYRLLPEGVRRIAYRALMVRKPESISPGDTHD